MKTQLPYRPSKNRHPVPTALSFALFIPILMFAACSVLCFTGASVIGGWALLLSGFLVLYALTKTSQVYSETVAKKDAQNLEDNWWIGRMLPNIPGYVETTSHTSLQGVKWPEHAALARMKFINDWDPDAEEFEKQLDVAFGFIEGEPFDLKKVAAPPRAFNKATGKWANYGGYERCASGGCKNYYPEAHWLCDKCEPGSYARYKEARPHAYAKALITQRKMLATKRDLCKGCGRHTNTGTYCEICNEYRSQLNKNQKLVLLQAGEAVMPSVKRRNNDRLATILLLKKKQNRAKQLGDMKSSDRLNEQIHKLEVKQYEEDALLGIL